MKITTPEEFAARPDPNAPRSKFVDMMCIRIERELDRGRLDIPASCVLELGLRLSELEVAADRYRAVGWTVYVAAHGKDVVMRLGRPVIRDAIRRTVPGSTLADHIGSPDSASPYREGKDR